MNTIRDSTLRFGTKDNLPATDFKTHRKNENQYSFASPLRVSQEKQYNLSLFKFRSPLRQQQVEDYNRIKTELKRGIELAKQNISLNRSDQFVSVDQYNRLNQQHKYQTERLLFQIQKLHESIYQMERNRSFEVEKLKEGHQQMSILNISNIRQTHNAQVDLIETQLRKTKQMLNDKTSQYQNLMKRQERQIKHLHNQNNRLSLELRAVIEQKNSEIQTQQRSSQQLAKRLNQQSQNRQKQMQQLHLKSINSFQKLLQNKEIKLIQNSQNHEIVQSQNQKLIEQIQFQRQDAHQKIVSAEEQGKQRYNQIKKSLQRQCQEALNQMNKNYQIKQEILGNQIAKLKKYLAVKNQERQKLLQINQQRINLVNNLNQQLLKQNKQLKAKFNEDKHLNMQYFQILKVKMSSLHENDLNSVIKTYQSKIETLIDEVKDKQGQVGRLRRNLYQQTNLRHQMRKKYTIQISKMNAKVIKLRSGLSAMQVDMKQKIQNQRSMMLLTSRSIIKDVESKTSGLKFHQQQLRKLRQLFDLQQKQIQSANTQVEEKIKIAQQQLGRLSKKIIDQKNHHQQTENQYKAIVKEKDQVISKLQHQLQTIQFPEFDNSKQLAAIEQLQKQIHQKNLENGKLKDKCELLEKKIHMMKAQIDQYQLEHQITHQEAKKQYQRISHENMDQFKKFYESRISNLEQDKIDLKQLISSKDEKITSLVQKYQELQKAMKKTVSQIRKRTELETKVMELGMDNNLIKNMVQIVKNNIEESS